MAAPISVIIAISVAATETKDKLSISKADRLSLLVISKFNSSLILSFLTIRKRPVASAIVASRISGEFANTFIT